MRESIRADMVKALSQNMIDWRRALHRIPEIGNDLPETLAYITGQLKALGLSGRACGKGFVVDFGSTGPLIAIRADMDGLPITEESGASYASVRNGCMHACGHDAHSAALLGCALVLSKIDPGFRVRLIFQPGEEGYFGAVGMIDDGCLEGVNAIVGGHVGDLTEELKPGQFGFRSGVLLAAADRFEGVFIGKGCHGSAPHRGRDPIPALAEYILACHVARSREFDQSEQVVLSICAVSAGTTHNVIPERATFLGTARTLSPEDRVRAKERLAGIGEGIALATGTKFEFTWLPGYPPLCNHPEATKAVSAVAQRLFGPDRVVQIKKANMGGEDFAYYLQRVPGSFWFLNTNDPARGIDKPNHNARFDVDERYLWEMAWLNLSAAAELAFPSAGA